jgi:hypothetical protein
MKKKSPEEIRSQMMKIQRRPKNLNYTALLGIGCQIGLWRIFVLGTEQF